MLENKKHIFWQAFFLTLLVFALGFVLGIIIEQRRADNSNFLLYQSEADLYDSLALNTLSNSPAVSCDVLIKSNFDFADKIYTEAIQLEKFDDSNKITISIKAIHKKYDLLRTILWMNTISLKQKCGNFNTVVYLYEYDSQDIETKAQQVVWSRALGDLKQKYGEKVILIPIASNQNVSSLDYLMKTYKVNDTPAVIVNEKNVIYDVNNAKEIEKYLK
jgi:hypothetical protein